MISTTVRCFRTADKGMVGYGVWLMTRPHEPDSYRGLFIHGERDELQAPEWTTAMLAAGGRGAVEITPEEALQILERWPVARGEAEKCFARHPVDADAPAIVEPS